MKAYKLININGGNDSGFLEGTVPEDRHIETTHFFRQSHFDKYQLSAHPAPRYQYVVTLKGKLKFTVTNGDSFIIEPGILLIADDLHGKGHTWQILDGDVWERLYIVLPEDGEDHFKPLS